MRGSVLIYAIGASLVCHATLMAPSLPRFFSQKPSVKEADQEELVKIEIRQFYQEVLEIEPTPQETINKMSPGAGWMKKITPTSFIQDDVTYASYIRDLILRELSYPQAMRFKKEEVGVRVVFTLDQQGKLKDLNVTSNVQKPYSQAALQAVKQASTLFPPFPPSVQKPEQRFSFLLLFHPQP